MTKRWQSQYLGTKRSARHFDRISNIFQHLQTGVQTTDAPVFLDETQWLSCHEVFQCRLSQDTVGALWHSDSRCLKLTFVTTLCTPSLGLLGHSAVEPRSLAICWSIWFFFKRKHVSIFWITTRVSTRPSTIWAFKLTSVAARNNSSICTSHV